MFGRAAEYGSNSLVMGGIVAMGPINDPRGASGIPLDWS